MLADAGYGISAAFRQGLDARKLAWAVGIPRIQKVYKADVALVWPKVPRGRPRKIAVPDQEAVPADMLLAAEQWRTVTWREGTKGALAAEFTARRVRVADGPEARIGTRAGQHLPGAEAWLIGEHRVSGERKYYLSNLPADMPLEELGLDHFEGRAWHGLHHHALMVMVACVFLQYLRLTAARKKRPPAPQARHPSRHSPLSAPPPPI